MGSRFSCPSLGSCSAPPDTGPTVARAHWAAPPAELTCPPKLDPPDVSNETEDWWLGRKSSWLSRCSTTRRFAKCSQEKIVKPAAASTLGGSCEAPQLAVNFCLNSHRFRRGVAHERRIAHSHVRRARTRLSAAIFGRADVAGFSCARQPRLATDGARLRTAPLRPVAVAQSARRSELHGAIVELEA